MLRGSKLPVTSKIVAREVAIICIRHHCEGEMGSSQHKSPHQARAFMARASCGDYVPILPYPTMQYVGIFSYEYLSETVKTNCAVKRKDSLAAKGGEPLGEGFMAAVDSKKL